MSTISKPYVTAVAVHHVYGERSVLTDINLSVMRGDCIGLIGPNGHGKSTLMKIFAGELEPRAGSVQWSGKTYYLPQLEFSLFQSGETVGNFVAQRNVPWPLVRASLDRLFSLSITPEKELRTLSGGEFTKLLIALCDTQNPDVLLLDEPTNHLDVEGIEVLKRYLLNFKGAFVVVSHDPLFLNEVVNTIWKIENGALSVYGGNYTHYKEQEQHNEDARKRELEAAKKKVKQVRRAVEARETRAARAISIKKKGKQEKSRDKYADGYFTDRSQNSAGRLKQQQERTLEEQKTHVHELKGEAKKRVHLPLSTDGDRSRRMLVDARDVSLVIENRKLLEGASLRIVYGDRIVITGRNGSGKSSFVKALLDIEGPYKLAGNVHHAPDLQAVYVDQKYAVVDPEKTLFENILLTNPYLQNEDVYRQMGRFLFSVERDIKRNADGLSGGEMARLTMAMVTATPIDLLVLDEPTNNLDIETLDVIASALIDFPGALVVISHNVHFLSELEIERAYMITNSMWREMKSLPREKERFYKELANSD